MSWALALALCMLPCLRSRAVVLHKARQSASDLEVGGSLAGVPRGKTRFVRYAELLALPQETEMAVDDTNFGRPMRMTGIALARLPALLGAKSGAAMVIAMCDDAYAAHYAAEYLRVHHPVLVLRLNGKAPAQWPRAVDGEAMGPYVISHPHFAPSFHVLAHRDEAQVPWGVVRLDFRDEAEVYAPIKPPAVYANDLQVQQGYTIARQNCFRCHEREDEGGTKSNRAWDVVARRAAADPRWFDQYVRAPKSVNRASQMAASPQYDAAAMQALQAYFKLFAGGNP
jgi:mono/diheme cytochrome c family protein